MNKSKAKPKIVAIDDTTFICETLKAWLSAKYDIVTFLNGKDGLDFIKENNPDLVLLDYEMPGMTGYEVLMGIRSNHSIRKSLPVLFLTAVTNERMEMEMMDRGANGYIRKPLDITVLNREISKHLSN